MRRPTPNLVVVGSILATVVAVVGSMIAVPAAAATSSASKPSTSVLVPVSAATAAGFPKVVSAPSASTNTGVTGCPDGAHEEFASASGKIGLVSEVLYCESAADADALLKGLESNDKAQAGLRPPKSLGSTAVERLGSDSSYLIAWRRGAAFELIGLSTDLPSSSTTSTTTGTPVPLTASDKQVLANAATQQSARFTNVPVSSGTSGSAADAKAQAAANAASVAAGCPKNPATALHEAEVEQRTGHDHRSRQGIYRHGEDRRGHIRHCARCKGCPPNRQQLRLPGSAPLLRLRDLPSGHPGVRGSNGGPDRDGEWRPGVHHPRRAAREGLESCRPVPARIRGHGQHRPTE